jgi:hypothetical protein
VRLVVVATYSSWRRRSWDGGVVVRRWAAGCDSNEWGGSTLPEESIEARTEGERTTREGGGSGLEIKEQERKNKPNIIVLMTGSARTTTETGDWRP